MTTITSKDLKALRDAAMDGTWIVEHNEMTGFDIIKTDCEDGILISADVCTQSSVFIVGTVNAYRSGLLVHVDDIDEHELLDEMRAERDEAREALRRIIARSENGLLGTSKVQDMAKIARDILPGGLDHSRAALSQGEDGA